MTAVEEPGTRRHVVQELGFAVRSEGQTLTGSAEILPQMLVPGADHLRTSVLAMWTDMLSGLLAAQLVAPAVPVTVELDVHLYRPLPAAGTVRAVGTPLRRGRTMSVAEVRFTDGDGDPLALGGGSFVTSPDPSVRLPANVHVEEDHLTGPRLSVPLAERARCERQSPGVAVLPRTEDGLNSSNTVNGGLIALAVEEAVLGLAPPGGTVGSLAVRYLHPVRVGPVLAEASLLGGLARVELRDAGSGGRLSAMATARMFGDAVPPARHPPEDR